MAENSDAAALEESQRALRRCLNRLEDLVRLSPEDPNQAYKYNFFHWFGNIRVDVETTYAHANPNHGRRTCVIFYIKGADGNLKPLTTVNRKDANLSSAFTDAWRELEGDLAKTENATRQEQMQTVLSFVKNV